MLISNTFASSCTVIRQVRWGILKDDRISGLFLPPPPSERKITSLLLYTMTSLLLILTAFGRAPLPPRLRSSFKYPPLAKQITRQAIAIVKITFISKVLLTIFIERVTLNTELDSECC